MISLTSQGIEILDYTNSTKRLGMILCENIISKSIQGSCDESLINRFKLHWVQMQKYEKEQALYIYNLFVENNRCKKLDFMIK